jgi:hypothetical protein
VQRRALFSSVPAHEELEVMTLFCNFEGRDHYIHLKRQLINCGPVQKQILYTAPKAGNAQQCKTHKNHAPSPGFGVITKYGGSILA